MPKRQIAPLCQDFLAIMSKNKWLKKRCHNYLYYDNALKTVLFDAELLDLFASEIRLQKAAFLSFKSANSLFFNLSYAFAC